MITPTSKYDMTSMGLYLSEIGDLPRLTHAEERQLSSRIKQGDEEAKQRMILANLRLVVYTAKRYGTSDMDLGDHIQNGYFGLVKAVEQFDGGRNIHFSTYAVHWIRQAVTREQQYRSRLIRLPLYIQAQIHKMDMATDEWFVTHGTDAPVPHLAATLNVDVSHIQMLQSMRGRTLSLDYTEDATSETTLAERFFSDPASQSPFEEIGEQDEHNRMREHVRHALSVLNEREQTVVTLYFGLDGGGERTYAEVGRIMGVSRERVRQILVPALSKLSREELLQSLCSRSDEMSRTA